MQRQKPGKEAKKVSCSMQDAVMLNLAA